MKINCFYTYSYCLHPQIVNSLFVAGRGASSMHIHFHSLCLKMWLGSGAHLLCPHMPIRDVCSFHVSNNTVVLQMFVFTAVGRVDRTVAVGFVLGTVVGSVAFLQAVAVPYFYIRYCFGFLCHRGIYSILVLLFHLFLLLICHLIGIFIETRLGLGTGMGLGTGTGAW